MKKIGVFKEIEKNRFFSFSNSNSTIDSIVNKERRLLYNVDKLEWDKQEDLYNYYYIGSSTDDEYKLLQLMKRWKNKLEGYSIKSKMDEIEVHTKICTEIPNLDWFKVEIEFLRTPSEYEGLEEADELTKRNIAYSNIKDLQVGDEVVIGVEENIKEEILKNKKSDLSKTELRRGIIRDIYKTTLSEDNSQSHNRIRGIFRKKGEECKAKLMEENYELSKEFSKIVNAGVNLGPIKKNILNMEKCDEFKFLFNLINKLEKNDEDEFSSKSLGAKETIRERKMKKIFK